MWRAAPVRALRTWGSTASTLEAVLPEYLYRYRKGGQYADQDARREPAAV